MIKAGLVLIGAAFLNCAGILCAIPCLTTIYKQPPKWVITWILCTILVGVVGMFVGFIGLLFEQAGEYDA